MVTAAVGVAGDGEDGGGGVGYGRGRSSGGSPARANPWGGAARRGDSGGGGGVGRRRRWSAGQRWQISAELANSGEFAWGVVRRGRLCFEEKTGPGSRV